MRKLAAFLFLPLAGPAEKPHEFVTDGDTARK